METILEVLPSYVLLFAAFAILGWIMEVVLKYIQYHRFINRGFLIGPYCPIYGWGALCITLVGNGVFFRRCTPGEAFLVGFVLCGALEYFVSWYMEKTSHARWWDYSGKPMNLNGRIWIGNLILFGLAAVAIVYLADPFLFALMNRMPERALRIAATIFLAVLVTDQIISHFLMRTIRSCIELQQGDNTEEIRLELHKMLRDRALLLRRINQAYPDLLPRPARLSDKLKQARAEYRDATKRLQSELRQAEQALNGKRRKVRSAAPEPSIAQAARDALDAPRARVRKAKAAQQNAREKLFHIENNLFGAHR